MTTSDCTPAEQAQIHTFNTQVRAWCKEHGTYTGEINGREFHIQNNSHRTWQGWHEEWEGWFEDNHAVTNVADTPHGVCYE